MPTTRSQGSDADAFTPNTITMPILRPEYLQMVPEFSGNPELLPRFISSCEKLVSKFYNANDPQDFQNDYLMSCILSKIKGNAAIHVANANVANFRELKAALLQSYADKRDTFTLTMEMTNLRQTPLETPFDFYNKVQKYLSLQLSFIQSHYSTVLEQNALSTYHSKLALRVLLKGLREPIGSLMRTKNPPNLSEALGMLTNDFQLDVQNTSFKRFNNTYTPNRVRPPQVSPNYGTPVNTFQNSQTQHRNFQNTKTFIPQPNPPGKRTFSKLTTSTQPTPSKIPFNAGQSTNFSKKMPNYSSHNLNNIADPTDSFMLDMDPISYMSYEHENMNTAYQEDSDNFLSETHVNEQDCETYENDSDNSFLEMTASDNMNS